MTRITEITDGQRTGSTWEPEVVAEGEALRLLSRIGMPEGEQHTILADAKTVLARSRPPDSVDGHETGLVMGYVQSGKTLSFTTVAAMAADNGFPLIIVLSGTTIPLSEQTVDRLKRDLDLGKRGKFQLFVGDTRNPTLAQNLKQTLEIWSGPEFPGFPKQTAIVSVMKHWRYIDALTESLRQINLQGRPCIVIDDEADQHGLNTKVNRGLESSTYDSLMQLRAAIPNHTYLQYTATPQANVLISVLDSLSPKFAWVLTPGNGYTGGREFFVEGDQVINVIPEHDADGGQHERLVDDGPPESLMKAMRYFFIGVATQGVHRANGDDDRTQPLRSMLIHPSMRQIDHFKYKTWVDRVRERWVSCLSPDAADEVRESELRKFRQAHEDLVSDAQHAQDSEPIPSFEDIAQMLYPAMHFTRPAWEVNSRKDAARWNLNNWSLGPSHILVGGENLGRGFTVEGLTVTYMPRGTGSGYADTIEQRARFFGYKKDYFGLCQVFLDDEVAQTYYQYVEHEIYLMAKLRELAVSGENDLTEWKRAMVLAVSMKPTRPSVLPTQLYRQLEIEDWTAQTTSHLLNADELNLNRMLVGQFKERYLFEPDDESALQSGEERHLVSRGISLSEMASSLLLPLAHSRHDAPYFSGLELVLEIYSQDHPDSLVDVYLMSGASNPTRRRRTLSRGSIQPFQGRSPADGSVYRGDRAVHSKVTTLQLHQFDVSDSETGQSWSDIPIVTVWLPQSLRKGFIVEKRL